MSLLRLLWSATATLAAPGLRLLLARRAAQGKEIPARLRERRGLEAAPRPPGKLIWLHAASVGETVSILPVIAALAPAASVLLTTGTVTSAALAAERLRALGLEGRVRHRFVPLDVPRWAARFLDHWRPDAAGFVESELWPNLLAACRRRSVPVALLNARLSPRSFARWRRAPRLARELLGGFAAIAAQSEADAALLRRLGAREVGVSGNLKLAAPVLPADPALLGLLRDRFAGRPAWLAASTHPGEEAIAAAVHRALEAAHPGLLSVIVPRHPERGEALAAALGAPRRAAGDPPPEGGGIWIADTLGELGLWYRLVPIVVVGRSLLPPGGGQNPLEPARLGCAVAIGPLTGNFAEPVARLRDADALREVADEAALGAFVGGMLADPAARAAMGARAEAAARGAEDLPAHHAALLLGLAGRGPP